MVCDICNKVCSSLESLKGEYQTEDIKELCSECARIANAHHWKLTKLQNGFVKTFMLRFLQNSKNNSALQKG